MASAPTYTPIQTYTVSGSAVTNFTWSSISQTYTDLVMATNTFTNSGSGNGIGIQFNGDTGSNYSFTFMYGDGSSASSGRGSNATNGQVDRIYQYGVGTTHFMNYSNTTTYKTVLSRGNTNAEIFAWVNLWRSTSAINSIKVFTNNGSNFNVGSTFTLYGIASA